MSPYCFYQALKEICLVYLTDVIWESGMKCKANKILLNEVSNYLHQLPIAIWLDLIETMKHKYDLNTQHAILLAHPQLQTLDLDECTDSFEMELFLEMAGTRLKNLQYIHLPAGLRCSEDLYDSLFAHLPNIRVMVVYGSSCCDTSLSTLSTHCVLLEHFDLSCCRVSDYGMHLMFEKEFRHLRTLCLGETDVTEEGIVIALRKAPNLQTVQFNGFMFKVLKLLYGNDMEKGTLHQATKLNLKELDSDWVQMGGFLHRYLPVEHYPTYPLTEDCIEIASITCPQVENLHLARYTDWTGLSLLPLSRLTKLHTLKVSLVHYPLATFFHLLPLLKECCLRLTEVHIFGLKENSPTTIQDFPPPSPFPCLQRLTLAATAGEFLPSPMISFFLLENTQCLEDLSVHCDGGFDDDLLGQWIDRRGTAALKNFEVCGCYGLSAAGLFTLLYASPQLRSVRCRCLTPEEWITTRDQFEAAGCRFTGGPLLH